MSRPQRRRRYQLASLGCWVIALAMWITDLAGDSSRVFAAIAGVATFGALALTIGAAANS